MPDYKKTEQIYVEQGITNHWKKPLEMLDDELFEAKVIDQNTKAYNQTSDLPVEYRKARENKRYPIREVLQIIRIKRVDGTEWLKSRGSIIGLDKAGNEVQHSFTDPELFYKPLTRHEFKRKDPRNENSPMERVCVEAGLNPHNHQYTEYTLSFNKENFDGLYEQRPMKSALSVNLVIYAEATSEHPRQITNLDHFTNRPFDDLWLEAITPKYKLDRNYSDSLEASHIG
jgi:hypothetical protein